MEAGEAKYFSFILVIIIVLILLCLFCSTPMSRSEFASDPIAIPQTPNCAQIRDIKVTPETLLPQQAIYLWFKSDNKNYVGPCRDSVFNYGPQKTWFDCETTCQADKFCDYWSYDKTRKTCLGHDMGTSNRVPDTSNAPGYISGQRFYA